MSFNFDPSTLLISLPIMLKGLLGIFAVIIVLWGLVALLNRVTGKKKNKEQ